MNWASAICSPGQGRQYSLRSCTTAGRVPRTHDARDGLFPSPCPPLPRDLTSPSSQFEVRCPGETSAISRAVHLARLAGGYPACRQCPHRDQVEGLSSRLAKLAALVRRAPGTADWFHEEGVGGGLHEGFRADLAGRLAAAFGVFLRDSLAIEQGNPAVVVAGDGRAWTQELLAAATERLRWAACDVVELGAATAPALAWAVTHWRADGGFYLGNPSGRAHAAGVKFFLSRGRPVSAGDALSAIRRAVEQPPRRPARQYGAASRQGGVPEYLERFTESFHGLRPLRFALQTTCRPFAAAVDRLLENTACQAIAADAIGGPGNRPAESQVHFAIAVDDDGERCRLWDERGQPVDFQPAASDCGRTRSALAGRTVAGHGISDAAAARLAALGCVSRCGHLRAETYQALVKQQAAPARTPPGGSGTRPAAMSRPTAGHAGDPASAAQLRRSAAFRGPRRGASRPLKSSFGSETFLLQVQRSLAGPLPHQRSLWRRQPLSRAACGRCRFCERPSLSAKSPPAWPPMPVHPPTLLSAVCVR